MLRTIVLAAFLLMSACYVAAAQQTTADQYADLQKNFAEAYNRKDVDQQSLDCRMGCGSQELGGDFCSLRRDFSIDERAANSCRPQRGMGCRN
nr:hypothetical protein [Bradyrhizobium sp. WSM1417]